MSGVSATPDCECGACPYCYWRSRATAAEEQAGRLREALREVVTAARDLCTTLTIRDGLILTEPHHPSIGKNYRMQVHEDRTKLGEAIAKYLTGDSALLSPTAGKEGVHKWVDSYKSIKGPLCLICGIMKRADGKNKPCKGPTRIATRKQEE